MTPSLHSLWMCSPTTSLPFTVLPSMAMMTLAPTCTPFRWVTTGTGSSAPTLHWQTKKPFFCFIGRKPVTSATRNSSCWASMSSSSSSPPSSFPCAGFAAACTAFFFLPFFLPFLLSSQSSSLSFATLSAGSASSTWPALSSRSPRLSFCFGAMFCKSLSSSSSSSSFWVSSAFAFSSLVLGASDVFFSLPSPSSSEPWLFASSSLSL
mmetsp:Transcript_116882/g.337764  ORF Transcript_116882/g.337764 Transcript_116882/m.337764 type:complete len:208 (+) Transcript_116882:361-984(+)